MEFELALTPRYCLIDSDPWFIGIDPLRRYWLNVNGESDFRMGIPGLSCDSPSDLKHAVMTFRELVPNQSMELPTYCSETPLTIHCINNNLYAIPGEVHGAQIWHLFDTEAIEACLMTAHPDWKCAQKDRALGLQVLNASWQQQPAIA